MLPLLPQVFYFDIFQLDPDTLDAGSASKHATEVSKPRAALWSLSHLPLLGTIYWICVELTTLLAMPHYEGYTGKPAPHGRWQLGAAFACYLALGTLQQCLHRGSGRGSRRCGRRRRLAIRAVFVTALGAGQCLLAILAAQEAREAARALNTSAHDVQIAVTLAVDLGLLTALAVVELAGMRLVATDAGEEQQAQAAAEPQRLAQPAP